LRELAQGIVAKNNWRPSSFLDEVRALIAPRAAARASEVA
jgi:hypothetical protein